MTGAEPKQRILLSWSSGKDSAWCLHELQRRDDVVVAGLLTSFNADADRVAMHAVRRVLAEEQADAAGLQLFSVDLPWPCPNAQYEDCMQTALRDIVKATGITAVAYGDLFLEDIRRYRERQMAAWGLDPLFPIWGRPTDALAEEMLAAGLEAVLTCVDPSQCPGEFAGRRFDADLLQELPREVDRCGENGEFHTFACAGPMFSRRIDVAVGDIVARDGFVFADLTPRQPPGARD